MSRRFIRQCGPRRSKLPRRNSNGEKSPVAVNSSMPRAVARPASSSARVERGSRLVHLAIELDPAVELPADPWHAYFAARFAWDSAAADLWRGVHGGRHPTVAQQLEAPDYVEIDSGAGRTAILTAGLTFHRRSGPRILDSLLIVRGETAREFRLAIGVDLSNPTAAAMECLTPVTELAELARPPAGERQGWLFHLDARSVLATHWQALGPQHAETAGVAGGVPADETMPRIVSPGSTFSKGAPIGFRVRVLETSGQMVRVRLRVCRPVAEGPEGRLPRSEPWRPGHRARFHFLRPGWPRMGRD